MSAVLNTLTYEITIVNRQIGRLQRDIKNYPTPLKESEAKLAALYETLGQLTYERDVYIASHKKPSLINRIFRKTT